MFWGLAEEQTWFHTDWWIEKKLDSILFMVWMWMNHSQDSGVVVLHVHYHVMATLEWDTGALILEAGRTTQYTIYLFYWISHRAIMHLSWHITVLTAVACVFICMKFIRKVKCISYNKMWLNNCAWMLLVHGLGNSSSWTIGTKSLNMLAPVR